MKGLTPINDNEEDDNQSNNNNNREQQQQQQHKEEGKEEDIQCNLIPWLESKGQKSFQYCQQFYEFVSNQFTQCIDKHPGCNSCCVKTKEVLKRASIYVFGRDTNLNLLRAVFYSCYQKWAFFKFSVLLSAIFFFLLWGTTRVYLNGNELQNLAELNNALSYLCVFLLTTVFFSNITMTMLFVEYMSLWSIKEDQDGEYPMGDTRKKKRKSTSSLSSPSLS